MDATLKRYFEHIIALEQTIYTQQRTHSKLNNEMSKLAIPRNIVKQSVDALLKESEGVAQCKKYHSLTVISYFIFSFL